MPRVASRHLVVVLATLLATGWLSARPLPALAAGSISLTTMGSPYTQDFNTLASAGITNTTLPVGWDIWETGGGGRDNEQYAAGNGSDTTGDTYSFGALTSADRAYGGLLSGTLVPTIGASFTNNTGDTVAQLSIAYTGEFWRAGVGDRGAADRLDFQLSTNATSLDPLAGTWTSFDSLDLNTPLISTTVGLKDGNLAANRTAVSFTIAGLSIANGSTFWIRWLDFNIASSDDGLGVDDFSLTPLEDDPIPSLSISDVSASEGDSGTTSFDFIVSLSSPAGPSGVTFDIATADNTATIADNDYAAQSLVGQSIAEGGTTYPFSVTVNGDTTPEPDETFFVNVTNVTGATLADGQGLGTILNDDVAADSCGNPYTPIYTIQGSGPSTPIPGAVITEGIVVGDFEGTTAASGFYIQEPNSDANDQTSEGIFVFTGSNASAVNAGDRVRVTGFARERFTQTTLNGTNSNTSPVTNIQICSTGNPLPAPTQVLLPVTATTDFEKFEGMRVTFTQDLVIAEYFNYGRFGEIVLAQPLAGETRPFNGTAIDAPGAAANARIAANLLSRITLDDVQSAQNPAMLRHPNGDPFSLTNYFRGGDTVTDAMGVLGFDFSLYRLLPTGPATYTAVNTRPGAPVDPGGRISVAAQNTLNFFLTLDTTASDSGSGPCGGLANLDCRGADSHQPLEFTRQRDKLLATLAGLDADVIGLNEIENTPGVDPLGDPTNGIVAGLNAMFGPGTYDYIDTDTIGTDAIKVGLIYRPAAVTPVGLYEILDSSDDIRFIDTRSRPVLAQTFKENATAERFTVAVNHLKSKGSACAGDPDALDGQGNCNVTRTQAAAALVDWLAGDPTGSGDPDFLIIGDLNAYAREDPITTVKIGPDDVAGTSDDYTNLVNAILGTYAYSYTFDGQAGYLDHALSSATLTGQVSGVAEWHINSDEANVLDYDTTFKPASQDALYEALAYRSSDHDGVIVGLNLFGLPTTIVINGGDDQSTPVTTNFPTQLDLTVTDSEDNPVAGVEVTFAAPLTGASATILEPGPYFTDSNGNLVVTAQANATAGAYDVVATAGSGTATFHLTNLAGAADHLVINAGDGQSTTIDTDFATQLDLTVYDVNSNPVPNATVTFAGPVTGASASIVEPGPYLTDANGNLVVTAHANTTAGGPYDFVATSGTATATFHLTNLVGDAAGITINAGDDQSTTVDSDFATQLDLTVVDAGNNPVPNATVTFAGPLSGASGTIVEAGPYVTDSNGNLVVTAHANATAGGYDFVATSGAATATFHLTNLTPTGTAQLSSGADCSTFAGGTATTLDEITYGVNKGKINALSQGSFSYWASVTATAGTNTFTINQAITSGNFSTLFSLGGGSSVFKSNCASGLKAAFAQSSTNASAGTVAVTFTAPTAGTYYLNIKFSTNSVKGETPPSPTTVHYVFSMTGVSDTELELTKP